MKKSLVLMMVLISVNICFADPNCPTADITGDCFVDLDDFAIMASQWLVCPSADLNGDCFVDFEDFSILSLQWLEGILNDPNLIGYWTMDDNAGNTTVLDSINGHDGTFNDAGGNPNTNAHDTTGQVNGALNFDGVDDYVAVADADSLDVTAVTISAWVYLDSGWAAPGYVVAKLEDWANSSEMSYILQIDASRKLVFAISADGNIPTKETTNDAISLSTWHHVAVTYEYVSATPYYNLYVDGFLVASDGNGNAGGTIHIGTGRLTMGARYDASDVVYKFFFNGDIDDVMIFDTVLTGAEVLSLYSSGL